MWYIGNADHAANNITITDNTNAFTISREEASVLARKILMSTYGKEWDYIVYHLSKFAVSKPVENVIEVTQFQWSFLNQQNYSS